MSRRCSKSVVCGFAVLALWTSAPACAGDLSGAFAPIGVVTGPLIKAIIAAAAAIGAVAKTTHDHRSKSKEPSVSSPGGPGTPTTDYGMCGSKGWPCVNPSDGKPPDGNDPDDPDRPDKPRPGRGRFDNLFGKVMPIGGLRTRQGSGGQLLLRFERRADFHHLVYSVSYQAASTNSEDAQVYALRGESLLPGVEVLSKAQAKAEQRRLHWPADHPPRLCKRDLRLGSGEPSCDLVLRVTPDLDPVAAARGSVRYFATRVPQQPADEPSEELLASPGTVWASADVAMKDTLFVTLKSLHHGGTDLIMVQRDLDHPGQFEKTILGFQPGVPGALPWRIPSFIDQLELSRDGSRLYMDAGAPGWLMEWAGRSRYLPDDPLLQLDEQHAGGDEAHASIGGIGVTDDGVCVVSLVSAQQAQAAGQQAPAQWTCKRQDEDGWSPLSALPIGYTLPNAQIFVRSMPRFSVAARGNSLMIAVRGPRIAGPLQVAYVRDAMQPEPEVTVKSLRSLTERGGAQLSGVLPLGDPAAPAVSPLRWLLYGRFLSASAATAAPMSMLSVSTTSDGSPVIQATPAFGSYSLQPAQIANGYSTDSACVMTMPQNRKLVRVFHLDADGRRLQQVVVDRSSGQILRKQSQQVPEEWGAGEGAMRLLRDGDSVFLAVGAHDPVIDVDETSASVWFYALPRGSLNPKDFVLEAPDRLSFVPELRKMNGGHDVSAYVSQISQNTLMLMPVVPANQDDRSGLVTQ